VIPRIAEAEIGGDLRGQVQALLQARFPGYPRRSYFKLPPHFRYLVMTSGVLVAQMGVELRVIRVGSTVLRTFGVVDLCVRTSERSRGLGGQLLAEVTGFAGSPAGWTLSSCSPMTTACTPGPGGRAPLTPVRG